MLSHTLHTLPGGERMSTRKAAKAREIERETERLKIHIDDLETNLALNKEMLHDILSSKLNESNSEDTVNISYTAPRMIEQLLSETKQLEETLKKLITDRSDAQGKALINEQISAELQRKEQELIQEYEDKLQEIKYQNDKKERIICELMTRNKQLEIDAELYRKSRNMIIVPPTDEILDLHCQTEELKEYMQNLARDLYHAQSHRDKLMENSKMLWSECQKIEALLKNPINRKQGVERSYINNLFSPRKDFSFEFKISDEYSDSEEDSSVGNELFEYGEVLYTTPNKQRPVPVLDFGKIKNRTLSYQDNYSKPSALSPEERALEDKIELMKQEINNMKHELSEETEKLLKLSNENSKILEKNEKLAEEYIQFSQKKDQIQDTICKMQKREKIKRGDITTEIKANAQVNSIVFKVALEGSYEGSEEIEIKPENFYGKERSFQVSECSVHQIQ
ncbi:unnamed protein product [Blepharisma stoltei]|uniref:Uncharacterized protein n=1 Tax=Blepharisma stoltei TaxID=1481888 RepID=A0AAU9IX58_9CILI|nr:unnamed protein product [Blepharisma stoltei]